MFEVCFQYDEPARRWEVIVKGATSALEALQGFNAAIITAQDATPSIDCNKAEQLADGTYKISVGIMA